MRNSVWFLGLCGVATLCQAGVNPIPKESGFSGYGSLSTSYSKLNSNVVVGPDEDESRRLNSWGDQASSSGYKVTPNIDLRYTMAESRTQLYLGTLIQDAVMFDFTQQFGVRKEFGDKGIGSIAYVFSAIPTEVWADPYLVGQNREKTDRKSSGVRLGWDSIWGSNFDLTYTYRDIKLDEERSGSTLGGLSAAERALLDRNGRSDAFDLSYNWMGKPGNILTPTLQYRRMDADGDAMSYKRTGAQLTYALLQPKYSLITNFMVAKVDYDEANPVFGKATDADEWGVNVNFFWNKLWNVDQLSAIFSVAYGESDSDVNFYDTDLTNASVGLLYKF